MQNADIIKQAIYKNGVRRILVRVTPSSPRFLLKSTHVENIEGLETLVCKVYVVSPAEEGRANEDVRVSLAKLLDLSPSALTLLSGAKSRSKFFSVTLP